ncbi:S9 family peptidase [Flavilitoribacter nigricans]|uniref:Peptidase S9 n=1 Tax=Flavilitoribacter nigricans (strain ATCC 23147 / DSM 23189 / NBRC 102662 / NCIMB 1420 / SS-2) TaxID=1122177 RepID=A0A2D0NF73_FLAN2|nr:prolyl oligopeptidase family serine peptidase [Flavilitoribacter nigricans]PHN07135.1 peptidase S9 [Flavilitoribacter nigricans DSM 23189 = NBRC 102662]
MSHYLRLCTFLVPFFFSGLLITPAFAQPAAKKQLEIEDLTQWNNITSNRISADGRWVVYTLDSEDGDPTTIVYDGQKNEDHTFERADDFQISYDGQFVAFLIHPAEDTVKDMRRRKVDKNALPGDTLAILSLTDQQLTRIPEVKNFKMPEKWDGWIAYLTVESMPADTSEAKRPKKAKKKNYERLVIRNLKSGRETIVDKVESYELAEKGSAIAWVTEGQDSTVAPGVYRLDPNAGKIQPVYNGKGKFKNLTFDEMGSQLAFVGDLDTTKVRVRPFGLFHYGPGKTTADLVLESGTGIMESGWTVSEHARLRFSENGGKLFFGLAPPPILPDTSLLEEEIPQVEVWSTGDGRLYTQQEVQLNRDKRQAYTAVLDTRSGQLAKLGSLEIPDVDVGDEGNAAVALGSSDLPYEKMVSWVGDTYYDLYRIDVNTGRQRKLDLVAKGNPNVSPRAKYFYWYSDPDSVWMAYSLADDRLRQITSSEVSIFYDELNDRPMHPSSYRLAGWLADDAAVLLYDRYDIWQIDPSGSRAPKRLTRGRENGISYRYVRLDPEQRFIEPNAKILLYQFDDATKESGYAWMDLASGKLDVIQQGAYSLDRRPLKAEKAEKYVYTKEDFRTFPDLIYGSGLKDGRTISNANPQQSEFSWGNVELYEWTSLDGEVLQGLLVKPDNFDPNKEYPLIVNFYERSSDGLYSHRAPQAHRSTINYSYYVSRGYVIFNPDIPYRIGYPGESCYNAVIPGVTSLIDEGFIDRDRIGVQGHSWGGYQIAYLVTKTDLFRCAEAGAPVVNMISAYGGIRWGSGMSRMFQYEHTQSRIGGTLWEYPLRYLENSPIFSVDKINTPVLIMHNDEDGAVPWYQGIEFFTAMRRLDKKAWMLNYNGEPHWPLKLANRKDFQKRMSQYFDYYLLDGPLPSWMERGVPAIEKGILQGY